jgi:hypothetical protein
VDSAENQERFKEEYEKVRFPQQLGGRSAAP